LNPLKSGVLSKSRKQNNSRQSICKTNNSNVYIKEIEENMLDMQNKVSFADIAGLDHVKQILNEAIIYPALRPDIYKGIRAPPKGILFYGPPGNGKTMLAKAVAT
jgi:SpoVK/Ycf46/Vps4 family AAA+-type ATPase